MLSRHEKDELHKIEQWFESTEPALVDALRTGRTGPLRRIPTALLVITDIVAFALLILAFTGTSAVLILLSLLVTSCAVCLHVARHAVP
ncbi:DUF3040 domain-containing protein [Amycolatopsis sp. CA-230715]|uniref:DUF3040 domain-containing protein n=1 Tax=Amycolatopsis sp. CA-230715 TaxID=2745196 RepID=UPI001C009666|nr:DUF3040 domain-containing protein [Amycolatopsis sp. CA-230715]QWF84605.1 hypothetical protein HUW46_08056 [Amycolatopsis sp. CA-230715]